MCDCYYFNGDSCGYEDYATGQSEDGYCNHGEFEYDDDGDETDEEVECDCYTSPEEAEEMGLDELDFDEEE
jgi:hypothetical protein